MNSELENPPFDPTPLEDCSVHGSHADLAPYTIVARGAVVQTPDKTLDESAWKPKTDGCESKVGFWRSLLGPSKAELLDALENMTASRDDSRIILAARTAELLELRRKVAILEKQVAIWEQTYQTASELAEQRIKDVALLRHQLASANEEVMRMSQQLDASVKPKPKAKRK